MALRKKTNRRQEIIDETSAELSMTPMIDVTFLLLVFFLCATTFKTLDLKMDSYLPQTGPDHQVIDDLVLPTEVFLDPSPQDPGLVLLRLGTVHVASFAELRERLRSRYATEQARESVPVVIHSRDEVAWEHVILALDAAHEVGVAQVQFGIYH